ncbi:uncharacterized protein [Macrobrachium rosenbergii]|uniref:uncharacterized protein n=1 Tax=Macrobrachium rosenbergii TaxID=79674 RepID=UPI0034D4A6A0
MSNERQSLRQPAYENDARQQRTLCTSDSRDGITSNHQRWRPLWGVHFLQFHLHWGGDDSRGSEHTIDGTAYPAELHLVHYNSKYASAAEALTHSDGLAVLGIFLEIGEANTKLTPIIDGLANVTHTLIFYQMPVADEGGVIVYYAQTSITPFTLQDLLPTNLDEFYRYSGSLTTPTCNEIVTWTVFKHGIKISIAQLNSFRKLLDSHGGSHLWSCVQPIHDVVSLRSVEPGVQCFNELLYYAIHQGLTGVYISLALQISDGVVDEAFHWGYEGTSGPSYWKDHYPACGGSSQSPIDIATGSTVGTFIWTPFTFINYNAVPTSMTVSNNGHTALVSAVMASPARIMGAELPGEYTFLQFHFHWGSDNTKGSEHLVNENSYPCELHLVHYKTEYGSAAEAMKYSDGLAVLGVFLEIAPADNPNLTPVLDGFSSIQTAGTEHSITPTALSNLLPFSTDGFYRYKGSLTTPTCNEIVIWTVFEQPIPVSTAQMVKFRQLYDEKGHQILENYRPVQPLNGRMVYAGLTSPHWSYSDKNRPEEWASAFPSCRGTSQSPIDIITAKAAAADSSWSPFTFSNYDVIPGNMTILNNGHTAQVTADMASAATVQGGGLADTYTFAQFHFHWGNDIVGSEHLVDGNSYPLELHLVHFKSAYGSLAEALKYADGLAVLGIFFKVDGSDNAKLSNVISGLEKVHTSGNTQLHCRDSFFICISRSLAGINLFFKLTGEKPRCCTVKQFIGECGALMALPPPPPSVGKQWKRSIIFRAVSKARTISFRFFRPITPFALGDLLPANVGKFYRYSGSLTTPTCNEVVTWTVFEEAVTISSAQLAKFRELKDNEGHEIVGNFRPVQDLNGREVSRANLA